MKKVLNIFIAGITAILPLSVTLFVLYKVFMFIDGLTANYLASLIGFKIFGLGFITNIVVILLVGLIAKNIFGQRLLHLIEKAIKRIPIAQTIYGAVKEILSSVLKKDKTAFQKPVLVDFPQKGTKSIGFITNDNISLNGNKDRLAVFVPTTPNPTTGFLIFVNKEEIEPLDISIDEAMKLIISLGVLGPSKNQ